MKVLVTAASRHGATWEIARAIAGVIRKREQEVDLLQPSDVAAISGYDAAVIGSAVYTGHWLGPALEFVRRSADELAARPVWLFSSGPVGDPSRGLVQRMTADPVDLPELVRLAQPREHRLFAGRLEKQGLTRAQRVALTVVRGLEGDFRDWAAIESWAASIADRLTAPRAPGAPEDAPVQERSAP